MKPSILAPLTLAGVLLAVPCFLILIPPPGCGADRPADQKPSVEDLIKQLGSDSSEERQAATRLLMDRKEAAPALRQALKSPDAEVRKRAATILKELDKGELAALAKNGEIDLLIERLVHLPEGADEEVVWQAALNLVSELLDLEKKKHGHTEIQIDDEAPFLDIRRIETTSKSYRPSTFDFSKYEKAHELNRFSGTHVLVQNEVGGIIRAGEVTIKEGLMHNLIASSGPVRTKPTGLGTALHTSILLCGDSVEVDIVSTSVIVCDGDLTVHKGLHCCLVVASGRVKSDLPWGLANSVIVTASKTDLPKEEIGNNVIKEKEPNALGLVKFFDLAQVGIEAVPAEGGVRVKKLAQEGVLSRAGLRADDLVVAVGDRKVDSLDSFRRILRKPYALAEPITLQVKRDGKPLKVTASPPSGVP